MEYRDILMRQKDRMRKDLEWWPNFFYHFTDVHNAVNILKSGWIFSRDKAADEGVMVNNNASRAVIDVTTSQSKGYGRLYFRPLTPTQYHNEGYKPLKVRNPEINASCPVPVFLCLSSVATLNYPGTKFAEKGLAGNRGIIQEGVEKFSLLNFEKIYHEGGYDPVNDGDIKEYRHSEVIHEGGFPVEPLLKCILCRTDAEKETLLYLIKNYSLRMYNSYKNRIFYRPKLKCFNYNGIFLKNVQVCENKLKLEFNDPEQRVGHKMSDVYFEAVVELGYIKKNGQILLIEKREKRLNYSVIRSATLSLKKDIECDLLRVRVMFDGEVMYENEIDMLYDEFI